MKTQINICLKRFVSGCIMISLLISVVCIPATAVFAQENNFEKVTLTLNSNVINDLSIDLYMYENIYYITIDDLCVLTRCTQSVEGNAIVVTQGFWSAWFDINNQVFYDGYQTVDITILEVSEDVYAVPALIFLNYYKAATFIKNNTLYCRMPECTAWEALYVNYDDSLIDIYELYGGEGHVKFSLTLDILMDFIMGDMANSDDYLSDAFISALKVDLYDYSSVQEYKKVSQSELYFDLHSDKCTEFIGAIESALPLAEEPIEWYIQYYYNTKEKDFVNAAYNAYEAGQHNEVTKYGKKFYEAFAEKNRTSETIGKYFDNIDYLMLFLSAAVETAQEMKYIDATNNLVYDVMGQENLKYLKISADGNDWYRVANKYRNVLGVATTKLEAKAIQLFTDKLCWDSLIGTGVSSAAGISGGAWTFSLNFARLFVENFPLTSSSVKAFKADRRAIYLSELQQNVYEIIQKILFNMRNQWDNVEYYNKYINAQQLYCRTSIAMYENLITMVDGFGKNRDYWTSLFQDRIEMLALCLYRLTMIQDDGVEECLPLELLSFTYNSIDGSDLGIGANIPDVIDYMGKWSEMVADLGMVQVSKEYSMGNVYEVGDFNIDIGFEGGIELRNNGFQDISICGAILGNERLKVQRLLENNLWMCSYSNEDCDYFITKTGDEYFYLNTYYSDNGNKMDNWYLTNWSEEEFINEECAGYDAFISISEAWKKAYIKFIIKNGLNYLEFPGTCYNYTHIY